MMNKRTNKHVCFPLFHLSPFLSRVPALSFHFLEKTLSYLQVDEKTVFPSPSSNFLPFSSPIHPFQLLCFPFTSAAFFLSSTPSQQDINVTVGVLQSYQFHMLGNLLSNPAKKTPVSSAISVCVYIS